MTKTELKEIYLSLRRNPPKIRRLYRGRYRYEIWRVTGPKPDDQETVDEVETFAGQGTADKLAGKLTRLTGIPHISAEYDALACND